MSSCQKLSSAKLHQLHKTFHGVRVFFQMEKTVNHKIVRLHSHQIIGLKDTDRMAKIEDPNEVAPLEV